MTPSIGFNVIGYVSGNLGLGVYARNVLELLKKKDLPFAVYDLDPKWGRDNYDVTFSRYNVANSQDLPFDINLFLVPPPALEWLITEHFNFQPGGQRLNVACLMWELMKFPKRWESMFALFDVLVAGSRFIHAALSTNITGPHILVADQPMTFPAGVISCREKFALPNDKVIFVSSFDPAGDPERKNPGAIVEAFRTAAGDDRRGYLVIKVNNAFHDGMKHPVLRSLEERCDGDPNIKIVTERMSYLDTLSFYASCDVFVSLHRSEGLGLALMEAMALGKPVIATAWSGNMTYMDHTNACLVDYRLIPVKGSLNYYDRQYLGLDTVWAEPNIQTAAAWIKKLIGEPELRRGIGERAARDMQRYRELADRGRFLDEIKMISEQRAISVPDGQAKQTELKRVQSSIRNYYISPGKRAMLNLRRTLDQQLLWRFQRRSE